MARLSHRVSRFFFGKYQDVACGSYVHRFLEIFHKILFGFEREFHFKTGLDIRSYRRALDLTRETYHLKNNKNCRLKLFDK